MAGALLLVGGEEFTEGCSFDRAFVQNTDRVLVVPTALAYEHPAEVIERARRWFADLDVAVDVLDVYRRVQAVDEEIAGQVANAKAIYVTSGSPMHLRSVLKDSPLLDALVQAWRDGASVALAGEASSVACRNMVDSRGGAFTVGLNLISTLTVVPRLNRWSPDKWDRTVKLASAGLPVVGIDEATALIRTSEGEWQVEGNGSVNVFVDGMHRDLSVLP